jgi:uncharacterized membrane protein YphA (DoxX/SURF4 family)
LINSTFININKQYTIDKNSILGGSMNKLKLNDLAWVSIILRLSIASLFLGAAVIKIKGGIDGSITYYMSMFEKSIFPLFLVKAHASIIMFIEFILAIWLISGYKLRYAWIASSLTLISLAFGMIFVYKFDVASDNYIYALVSLIGLVLSSHDPIQFKKNLEV